MGISLKIIPESEVNFMKKFLTLLLILSFYACQSESENIDGLPQKILLSTPSGEIIETILAISDETQKKGLSGVKPEDFDDNQAMLFFYLSDGDRHFWMPDTYFDLDIIFVDKDLKIIDIVRKLPHYVGKANPHLIPRSRIVWARHALEMKSSSAISQKLKIGDQLKVTSSLSMNEIEKIVQEKAFKVR